MNINELSDLLVKSAEGRNGKCAAWWDEDPEGTYRYILFRKEEVAEIEDCVGSAQPSVLSAHCGTNGFTLFHLLVWHNLYGAVEDVLKRKAVDPDITDGKGRGITALMLACCVANFKMAKLLLENGASETVTDADGRGCFHYLTGVCTGLTQSYRCKEKTYKQRGLIAEILTQGVNVMDNENKTPLLKMLTSQDSNISYSLIDAFIKKGADCNFIDGEGNTLLHIAIKNRHFTSALRLINGETVNAVNNAGETPLKLAKQFYCEGLCIALRDKGAECDAAEKRTDLKKLTTMASNAFACGNEIDGLGIALYLAEKIIKSADSDDDDEVGCIADLFFNALSADENCSVLDACVAAKISFTQKYTTRGTAWCLRDKCFSVRAGLKAVEKLSSLGVDLNSAVVEGKTPANIIAGLNKPNLFSSEKCTYFEDTVGYFSTESMTELDNDGTSAMHLAASRGHAEMLKAMINAGADINVTQDAPSEAGNTPLHIACLNRKVECVKALVENGADESVCNVKGETAAHTLFSKLSKRCSGLNDNDEKNCKQILSFLKNTDAQRNDGRTPLMLLQFCNINLIRAVQSLILDGGADVNKTDDYGRTALIIAADEHCFKETVKELVIAGADVNAADKSGKTALHYALRYGSQDVARYLIKKGADYNRADNNGVTPVEIAAESGYEEVLELTTDI